jgi:hypothetical protein
MSSHLEYSYLILRLLVVPQEEQSTVNPDQGSGMSCGQEDPTGNPRFCVGEFDSSYLMDGCVRKLEWKGHWTRTIMRLVVDILLICFSGTNIFSNRHSKDGCCCLRRWGRGGSSVGALSVGGRDAAIETKDPPFCYFEIVENNGYWSGSRS